MPAGIGFGAGFGRRFRLESLTWRPETTKNQLRGKAGRVPNRLWFACLTGRCYKKFAPCEDNRKCLQPLADNAKGSCNVKADRGSNGRKHGIPPALIAFDKVASLNDLR